MAPNASRLWTPRLTVSHFRAWTHTPQINEYPSPQTEQPSRGRKRTPTTLDEGDARETLEASLAGWEKEIAEIEKQYETQDGAQTLKEQLAGLMFSVDVTSQVKKQEYAWDPKGDGERGSLSRTRASQSSRLRSPRVVSPLTLPSAAPGQITKGEFRVHMRGLGLSSYLASTANCDALFEEWDADHGGSIDMEELELALKNLKRWEASTAFHRHPPASAVVFHRLLTPSIACHHPPLSLFVQGIQRERGQGRRQSAEEAAADGAAAKAGEGGQGRAQGARRGGAGSRRAQAADRYPSGASNPRSTHASFQSAGPQARV